MKSIVKSFICIDHDPLELYTPKDIYNFELWLQIFVGVEDQVGEEMFQLCVCSTKWIEKNHTKKGGLIGLYHIIFIEYNYDKIRDTIKKIFSVEGNNWDEIYQKLSLIGLSEYQELSVASDFSI